MPMALALSRRALPGLLLAALPGAAAAQTRSGGIT
jgi:hypothetical protein